MRKIFVIFLSLIIVTLFTVASFAETYEIDQFTGEIISSVDGTDVYTEVTRINSSCVYNVKSKLYIFTIGTSSSDTVSINLFDGEYTTGEVEIYAGDTSNISVYRDGKEVQETSTKFYAVSTEGSYTIINKSKDTQVLGFKILNEDTGIVSNYIVPDIYAVTKVTLNGSNKSYSGNTISLTDEGDYNISYRCYKTGVSKTLKVSIDHTAPVLEIIGVTDGIATGPVTFGDTESDSELIIKRNDSEVTYFEALKTAGDYEVTYIDKAGNESVYNFTIRMYIDIKAEFVIIFFVVLIIAIIGYMVYIRKNTRTF